MELTTRTLYTTVLPSILLTHILYLLIRRRIRARTLPPKFVPLDPFFTLDWTFGTSINGRRFLEYQRRLGTTYRLPTLWDPMKAVLTCDQENIQAVMAGRDWGVGWREEGMRELLGRGFLDVDGEEWSIARKMLRPGFNRSNVDDFTFLEGVVQKLLATIPPDGETVDVGPLLYDTFLSTSLNFILGVDAAAQNDGRPCSAARFNELWLDGLLGMGLRLLLDKMRFLAPGRHYRFVCKTVHAFVDFAIVRAEERLKNKGKSGTMREGKGEGGNEGKEKKSIVDVLLAQTSDKLYVRNQLLGGLLGNQDTTSVLCANLVQMLGEHPAVWTQLRKEVLQRGEELLSYDGVRECSVVWNVLMETLRIRPVFPVIARRALRPTILPHGAGPQQRDPVPIPAGTVAMANFWSLNLDASVFGPDPEKFKPERWNTIKPGAKEFMPFGTGPRSCLGMDKALAEAGYLLVRLAQVFERIEGIGPQEEGERWRPEVRLSMRNKAGYNVAFWRAKAGSDGGGEGGAR